MKQHSQLKQNQYSVIQEKKKKKKKKTLYAIVTKK